MIKGEFKKSVNIIDIEKNCVIFVFSGSLLINGEKLKSGKGFFFKDIEKNNFEAEDLTCLVLTYSGKDSARLLSNINQNNIFDFTISDELIGFSKLYFDGEKKYENEMLSIGIAQTVFSYITPSFHCEDKKNTAYQYVSDAEDYIEKNIANSIKIDDVSKHLGLSRGYLRNIFFEQKGISPQEYLMQKKIETACDLLIKTDLSIGEIAKKCGYDDILQFSRIFKKRMGISSTEYRKQNISSFGIKFDKVKSVNHNINIINKNKNTKINEVSSEIFKNTNIEKENTYEPLSYDSSEDLTAILAAQIEKAARAAEEERKEKEKADTAPLWLL